MNRVQTYIANQQVHSTELNSIQDNAAPAAGVWGLLLGGQHVYCHDNANIAVTDIAALTMGATGVTVTSASVSLTPSGMITLANNTWYYLYAYINAGAIAWEVSITRPDLTMMYKGPVGTPDTSRRYIAPFHTYAASTAIRCFDYYQRHYRWRFTAMANTEFFGSGDAWSVLSDTTASASGTANVSAVVTPMARMATVRMAVKGGDGTHLGTLSVRPTGDPSDVSHNITEQVQCMPVSASDFREYERLIGVGFNGSNPSIDYAFTPGNSSVMGNILLTGFVE